MLNIQAMLTPAEGPKNTMAAAIRRQKRNLEMANSIYEAAIKQKVYSGNDRRRSVQYMLKN